MTVFDIKSSIFKCSLVGLIITYQKDLSVGIKSITLRPFYFPNFKRNAIFDKMAQSSQNVCNHGIPYQSRNCCLFTDNCLIGEHSIVSRDFYIYIYICDKYVDSMGFMGLRGSRSWPTG